MGWYEWWGNPVLATGVLAFVRLFSLPSFLYPPTLPSLPLPLSRIPADFLDRRSSCTNCSTLVVPSPGSLSTTSASFSATSSNRTRTRPRRRSNGGVPRRCCGRILRSSYRRCAAFPLFYLLRPSPHIEFDELKTHPHADLPLLPPRHLCRYEDVRGPLPPLHDRRVASFVVFPPRGYVALLGSSGLPYGVVFQECAQGAFDRLPSLCVVCSLVLLILHFLSGESRSITPILRRSVSQPSTHTLSKSSSCTSSSLFVLYILLRSPFPFFPVRLDSGAGTVLAPLLFCYAPGGNMHIITMVRLPSPSPLSVR